MALLLIFISGFISSYIYLTDPVRIRAMSQIYLSDLSGGRVHVGSASLSLLEGLKLTNVTVHIDDTTAADGLLFDADAIEIQYNPGSLLQGRVEATRIIATGARVNLVENPATGSWNYQRLRRGKPRPAVTRPTHQNSPPLPQVVLRDAQVDYGELQLGTLTPRGSMGLDGRLFPSGDGKRFLFEMQSRGAKEGVGPVVEGQVTLADGQVIASLSHFAFGRDIEAMLPREVRDFWVAHQLQGALDVRDFSYTPAGKNTAAKFHLLTQLRHVRIIVRAEEFDPPKKAAPVRFVPAEPADPRAWVNLLREDARRTMALLGPGTPPPLVVEDVSGDFDFDEKGIRFDGVTGTMAGITLSVNGSLAGYSPDAAVHLRVQSLPGQDVFIPEHPTYLRSLPPAVRDVYTMLKPHGTGAVWVEADRVAGSQQPVVRGEVDIHDGAFQSKFFPYPVEGARGKIAFGPDPTKTFVVIDLQNVTGRGTAGGPNEHAHLRLTGTVAVPDREGSLVVRADHVFSEPALFKAFPPPVRHALSIFKGTDRRSLPSFGGDFVCRVFVPNGKDQRPIVGLDLNFTSGAGCLAAFPYPMQNLLGTVTVGDGYLDAHDVRLSHGTAKLVVNGHVSWPTDLPDGADVVATPDLKLVATNLPVDDTLLAVLPREGADFLRTIGVSGLLDVDGRVTSQPTKLDPGNVGYDLTASLHDAAAKLQRAPVVVTGLTANLRIHPDHLELEHFHGRRGDGTVAGSGAVNWSDPKDPRVSLVATAAGMELDDSLRKLLPAAARDAWDALAPRGSADADAVYSSSAAKVDYTVTVRPKNVTVTPVPLPFSLSDCTGTITVRPDTVAINHVVGRHGKAVVAVDGNGLTANPDAWDLSLSARDLTVDADLLHALPAAARKLLTDLKYSGDLSVDLPTLNYRGHSPDGPLPNVDLVGTLSARDGKMDAGAAVEHLAGKLKFDAAIRQSRVAVFHGQADVAQLMLADRLVKNLSARLERPAVSAVFHVTDIRGQVAGGDLAGNVDLNLPDNGPSTYSLKFVVQNADVAEVAKQTAPKGQSVSGQVSASLDLQGDWSDPANRRGGGDVLVTGKEMYQIPLMLGLMEVTNLSLPTTSPFNKGSARYLVAGQRVTFEHVKMESPGLIMHGNGWLDFGSKKVRMNFSTENPRMPNVPVIHDLIQGAREELLQIQVRGTVKDPKVSAASLHTFTTTVDEVLNGTGTEK